MGWRWREIWQEDVVGGRNLCMCDAENRGMQKKSTLRWNPVSTAISGPRRGSLEALISEEELKVKA